MGLQGFFLHPNSKTLPQAHTCHSYVRWNEEPHGISSKGRQLLIQGYTLSKTAAADQTVFNRDRHICQQPCKCSLGLCSLQYPIWSFRNSSQATRHSNSPFPIPPTLTTPHSLLLSFASSNTPIGPSIQTLLPSPVHFSAFQFWMSQLRRTTACTDDAQCMLDFLVFA